MFYNKKFILLLVALLVLGFLSVGCAPPDEEEIEFDEGDPMDDPTLDDEEWNDWDDMDDDDLGNEVWD